MNHLPVEEHIRGVVKDLLRTRGITKRGLVADINGTMKIPLKGLKYRLSLQVSSCYEPQYILIIFIELICLPGIRTLRCYPERESKRKIVTQYSNKRKG